MKIRPIKKRNLFLAMILLLIVIGAIVYKLADRYLIEHVEVVVQNEESTDRYSSNSSQTINRRNPFPLQLLGSTKICILKCQRKALRF